MNLINNWIISNGSNHFILNRDSIQKDLMEQMRNLGRRRKNRMTIEHYTNLVDNLSEHLAELEAIFQNQLGDSFELKFDLDCIDQIEVNYIELLKKDESYGSEKMDFLMMAYFVKACLTHLGGKLIYVEEKMHLEDQAPLLIEHVNYDGMGVSIERKIRQIKKKQEGGSMLKTIQYVLNKKEIQEDLMQQMKNLGKKKK